MRSEGTGFMAGGGFGGGIQVPTTPRPIPQGRRWDPSTSPTRMRELSPAEKAAQDARNEQLAQARKAKRAKRGNHGQPGFSGMSQEMVEEMIRLYKAGATAKATAEQVGCSRTTVLKYLELNNIPIRGGHLSAAELSPRMIELYQQGLSLRDVAEQLDVSTATVRRYLHDAGVEVRSQGQWRLDRRNAS